MTELPLPKYKGTTFQRLNSALSTLNTSFVNGRAEDKWSAGLRPYTNAELKQRQQQLAKESMEAKVPLKQGRKEQVRASIGKNRMTLTGQTSDGDNNWTMKDVGCLVTVVSMVGRFTVLILHQKCK